MFDDLRSVATVLRRICRRLDPARFTAAQAAAAIDLLMVIERLAAGARLRLAKRIDDSVAGAEGEGGRARWLAKHTGQDTKTAEKDLAASRQLDGLDATEEALRNGELSPTQAHEVTSGASADPAAEGRLLGTARDGSVAELRRQAKKVRAAATSAEDKARRAHERRDLSSGTDEEEGEGWIHLKGPAAVIATLLAYLEPWIQAEFAKARREGRREPRGAYAFDAMIAALRFAASARAGGTVRPDQPVAAPATILARVDVTAVRRGHTVAGETCELDGLGPVSVEDLLSLLPQAAIDLIVTNGVDVFNVTHLGRRANARQQVVMDWIGGQCSRLGCSATRHLQVDHRVDWAKVKVTELRSLDWLCPDDHHRKTHQGWALVAGTGKRRMVPPDDPAHPRHAKDPPGEEAA
jgi:hypothetical protein